MPPPPTKHGVSGISASKGVSKKARRAPSVSSSVGGDGHDDGDDDDGRAHNGPTQSTASSSMSQPAGKTVQAGEPAEKAKKPRKPKEAAPEVTDEDVLAMHASGGDTAVKKLAVDTLKKWLKGAKVKMADGSKVMWGKVKKGDLMELAVARIAHLSTRS